MSEQPPPVVNFYQLLEGEGLLDKPTEKPYPNYDEYQVQLPVRILIIGSGGSGKTNITANLVLGLAGWTRIVILASDIDQPLYHLIIGEIQEIEKRLGVEILSVYDSLDQIPDVDSFDSSYNTLVIVDDLITSSKTKLLKLEDFWVRGRRRGVSMCMLSQSYYKVPNLIRLNTSLLILKGVTKRELRSILNDYSLNKSVNELVEMYQFCDADTADNFFMIDKTPGIDPSLTYRHNFAGIDILSDE